MTGMTDSRAVEVLAEMRNDGGTVEEADYTAAIDHAIARLREPAGVGGDAVFNCPTCPVSVQGQWQGPECPECGERCYIDPTAAPQPPAEAQRCTCPSGDGSLRWPCPAHPAEAQAQGGVEVVQRHVVTKYRDGSVHVADLAPSAPVGVEVDALIRLVEGPGCLRWQDGQGFRLKDTQEWMAFYVAAKNTLAQQPAACTACNDRREVGGATPEGFETHPCPECAQQPAAVDGANRGAQE